MPTADRLSLSALKRAAELVYRVLPPTPQFVSAKLSSRAGCTAWVKHENHTPTGALVWRHANRLPRRSP